MLAGQDHIDMNIARLQKTLEKKSAVPNYEIFEDQSDTVRCFYIKFFFDRPDLVLVASI